MDPSAYGLARDVNRNPKCGLLVVRAGHTGEVVHTLHSCCSTSSFLFLLLYVLSEERACPSGYLSLLFSRKGTTRSLHGANLLVLPLLENLLERVSQSTCVFGDLFKGSTFVQVTIKEMNVVKTYSIFCTGVKSGCESRVPSYPVIDRWTGVLERY